MEDQQRVRVSDAEREAVVARLNDAAGEGRLSLDEFGERATRVYSATTRAELARLVDDLPARPAPAVEHNPIGTVKRGGRWRLDRDTYVSTTFGAVKLDLTEAELPLAEVHLSVRAFVGAVKIWLPPDVRVEVEGSTGVGSRRVDAANPGGDGGPLLRLRIDTAVGSVKVYRD